MCTLYVCWVACLIRFDVPEVVSSFKSHSGDMVPCGTNYKCNFVSFFRHEVLFPVPTPIILFEVVDMMVVSYTCVPLDSMATFQFIMNKTMSLGTTVFHIWVSLCTDYFVITMSSKKSITQQQSVK
jgi:hypothetical protein